MQTEQKLDFPRSLVQEGMSGTSDLGACFSISNQGNLEY